MRLMARHCSVTKAALFGEWLRQARSLLDANGDGVRGSGAEAATLGGLWVDDGDAVLEDWRTASR